MSLWVAVSLLLYSVAVTFVTRWLAIRLLPREKSDLWRLSTLLADLLWLSLLLAGGILARRYAERLPSTPLALTLFALLGFLLSAIRALLYQRRQHGPAARRLDLSRWHLTIRRDLVHLLVPIILYLLLLLLLDRHLEFGYLLPLALGALLPGLDDPESLLGRLLPFLSRRLRARLERCGEWHSLGANLLVALVSAPVAALVDLHAWALIPLAFLSHLELDLLDPRGIMLFWPLRRTRYRILDGPLDSSAGKPTWQIVLALGLLAAVLLVAVDVGPPLPAPVAAPSFEETLDRYYALRGRNLVFADVDGSWQATGRRVRARFEVLNAAGRSFVLLDNYTRRVFTAGQEATDDLYLDRISLAPGLAIQVKPVEIALRDAYLAEALPVLYQMQREPGLQHIYVSGDVVVPPGQDRLDPDYAQTSLRHVQRVENGHFSLRYLSAADFVELGDVLVEQADLVIVATYAESAAGPTATPLPSLPPTPAEGGP